MTAPHLTGRLSSAARVGRTSISQPPVNTRHSADQRDENGNW